MRGRWLFVVALAAGLVAGGMLPSGLTAPADASASSHFQHTQRWGDDSF